jgi:DNA transformation protein and related proteins
MPKRRHLGLFRNGRNQAVRIPVEFELPGDEAIMHRDGDRLVIYGAQMRACRLAQDDEATAGGFFRDRRSGPGARERALIGCRDWGPGMVASDGFAEFLREQLAPLGRVTMRRMFGKTGVFCDGVMLGMVTEDTLYFRVDDDNRMTFQEAESFPPLNYEKKGSTIDLSFWRVPERLFDEPDELVIWARAALAAARRVAAKRERTAPRRKSKPQPT